MEKAVGGVCHINLSKGFRGGERQTFLMVKQLACEKDQTVAVRKGSFLAEKLAGCPGVTVLEMKKPFWINLSRFKRFSLIHAHEAKASQFAWLVKSLYSVPYIITRRIIKTPKRDVFTKAVYADAGKVVAISRAVAAVIQQYDKRITPRVIPSSFAALDVNVPVVNSLKKAYENKFVVGHVGALVNRDKGQLSIVNAARRAASDFPDIHFLFLGQGPDEDMLKRAALRLHNVEFLGFKQNVGDYYKLFDLFVYPSLQEGLGSAVLDAFYFKLPVIASDAGGIPDLVKDRRTGILIPPADDTALFRKIVTLYQDRSLGKKLGENGYHFLHRFDVRRTAAQYREIYREWV